VSLRLCFNMSVHCNRISTVPFATLEISDDGGWTQVCTVMYENHHSLNNLYIFI
jgi:hypothetical protein